MERLAGDTEIGAQLGDLGFRLVLATPGMDRHAAYVALSRHRDGVRLHYGRDDFADEGKLVRTQSRDRAKDMAADYAAEPNAETRAFADRREIRLPERVREIVRTVETKARSMFAGFRPKPEPGSPRESTSRPEQDVAIRRYARAAVDISGMEEKHLPVLPHQRTALARVHPNGARGLAAAIGRTSQLARDAAGGDMRGAVRRMAEEVRVRADPSLRSERIMERWRALEAQSVGGNDRAVRVGMIDDLRHDPSLRAELERRAPELGPDRGRETPEKMLERQIEMDHARERQRDRGFD